MKKNISYYHLPPQGGQAAMLIVFFVAMISLSIALAFAFVILRETTLVSLIVRSKESFFTSEAGAEDLFYRIRRGKAYDTTEIVMLGSSLAEVNVSQVNQNLEIVSVSEVQRNFRTTKVALSNIAGIEFFYGVQVGEGGLEMGESSRIEGIGGTAGNVYSNGPVSGGNASTITGDVTVATNLVEDVQARSTVCNSDQIFGQDNPKIDMAQSFQPSATAPLAKVSLYLKKFGNPGDRTVRIVADAGGSPAQTSLANATLQSSLVGSSYAWIDVVFSNPATLTAGNTYWVVIDAARSAANYWSWCSDSNQGFGNGVEKYSQDWDDDPWTLIIGDLAFKTFFGSGVNALDGVVVLGDARANTITASKVCGDAYYQTIDVSSLSFLNSPAANTCPAPLTPGTGFGGQPDPPVQNMSISQANIDQWKLDSDPDSSPYSGDLNVTTDLSFGPEKITGNLNLTSNNKTFTVEGTIYVQGNIQISNGSTIQCSISYGPTSCIVMTDGWIHIENNGIFRGSGEAGSYIMLLTTSGCDGSAGGSCTHHSAAMDLHNNATGAIFYAGNGLIYLHNGVEATEVTAYKLNLENNAVVRYEQGLINTQFSSGPGGSRAIKQWREIP